MNLPAVKVLLKANLAPLAGAGVACLVTAAVAIVVAAVLLPMPADPACLADGSALRCAGFIDGMAFDHDWAGRVVALLTALPFVVGILVGGAMGAGEIEDGTASLTWFLEPTRVRWLLMRVAILGVAVTVALVLPALAGEVLARARIPRFDPSTTAFVDAGARGGLLVLRGIAAFTVATLMGLAVGRVLPALVLAGLLALLAFVFLDAARWLALPAAEPFASAGDRFVLEMGGPVEQPGVYVDAEGHLYTADEIRAMAPAPVGDPAFDSWYEARGFTQARYGIDGERLGFVPVREGAGLVIVTLIAATAASAVTRARRPY